MKLTRQNSTFEERLEAKKEECRQDFIFYNKLYKMLLSKYNKSKKVVKEALKYRNIAEKKYSILSQ